MKKNLRKNLELGILFGLVCSLVLSLSHFNAACDDLRDNVLRLHIIANSDAACDQRLKLSVRDAVLSEYGLSLESCTDLDDALLTVTANLDDIEKTANRVIKENGYRYTATAYVGESLFDTRVYDDFTLPAGKYKSLIIKLGEAKGHNWWCVIFPSVCIPAATDAALSDSTSVTAEKIACNSGKYVVKFKIIEWYEQLKNKIR